MKLYKIYCKPSIDFVSSFFGVLILSPIFILVSILLTITNKGNPFFFQKRPGKNNKIFTIIKFKTMNDKKNKEGALLSDAKILPIEVKSGLSKNLKSIRSYASKYNPEYICRISPRNLYKDNDFINLPLYTVFQIKNLI